jgi:hypothetical protein
LGGREEVKLVLVGGVELEVVRHAGSGIWNVVDHVGGRKRVEGADHETMDHPLRLKPGAVALVGEVDVSDLFA